MRRAKLGAWPTGGALARIARDGRLGGVVAVASGCDGGRLVRAGFELVVAHGRGELVVARFDGELHPTATTRVAVPGSLEAIAGRADGAIAIATMSDSHVAEHTLELAIIGRGGTDVMRSELELRGGDARVSQLIADGDEIVTTGLIRGAANSIAASRSTRASSRRSPSASAP